MMLLSSAVVISCMLSAPRPVTPTKAMFNFSLAESRRGAPRARPGCSNRFPIASADAALVELARKRRRVMAEIPGVMVEAYKEFPAKGSHFQVLLAGNFNLGASISRAELHQPGCRGKKRLRFRRGSRAGGSAAGQMQQLQDLAPEP